MPSPRNDPLLLALSSIATFMLLAVVVILALRIDANGTVAARRVVSPTSGSTLPTPASIASPVKTPVPATASPTAKPETTPTPTSTPTPTQVLPTARFSGLPTEEANLSRRPIAAMIDNFPSANPQFGMSKASVVFEALAEGGLTRFMPVFETSDLGQIGPIRSTRQYFIDWARPYGALLVHAGGSPQAMSTFEQDPGIMHLNLLYVDWPSWRGEEREAPHNLYTSGPLLDQFIESQEAPRDQPYEGFDHKPELNEGARPLSQTIFMVFSPIFSEGVRWEYDRSSNTYLRYQWDEPHMDALTNQQLAAKNVAVIMVPEAPVPEDEAGRLDVVTTGSGEMVLFQDGRASKGTWEKAAPDAPLRLIRADGGSVELNPGLTWIAVLPPGAELDYEPGSGLQ